LKNKNKNANKNFLPIEIRKKIKKNLVLKDIGDKINAFKNCTINYI